VSPLIPILAGLAFFFLASKAFAGGNGGGLPKQDVSSNTPGSRADFVARMRNAVRNLGFTGPGELLLVAHGAYESGWGNATAYRQGNNAFNITRGANDSGPTVTGGDTECDAAGNCRPITQRFRAYYNLEDSVADYLKFIQQPRFGSAYSLLAQGDPTFVYPLRQGGYYTQPADTYFSNIKSVLVRVQSIAQGGAA